MIVVERSLRVPGETRWLRRGLMLLLLMSGLAGCAAVPASDEFTLRQTAEPSLASDHMITVDGARLPLRVWEPAVARGDRVKAVVVALHGFNDYSNAFKGPGEAWAKRGIVTIAYDQRGFGAAPERGLWPGRAILAGDAATATRLAHGRFPGVPVYLLGESMGGAVALVAATGATTAESPVCNGLILVAPAVWGRATMGILPKAALWLASHTIPDMTFTGSGFHIKPSDNLEMLRAFVHDPLVIKATRVDAIKGVVDLMDAALENAGQIRLPTLMLYGDKDEVIPKEATLAMLDELLPVARKQMRVAFYPQGYHMLMRDLDAAIIVNDVASWIEQPSAPLPSGFDHDAKTRIAAAQ